MGTGHCLKILMVFKLKFDCYFKMLNPKFQKVKSRIEDFRSLCSLAWEPADWADSLCFADLKLFWLMTTSILIQASEILDIVSSIKFGINSRHLVAKVI